MKKDSRGGAEEQGDTGESMAPKESGLLSKRDLIALTEERTSLSGRKPGGSSRGRRDPVSRYAWESRKCWSRIRKDRKTPLTGHICLAREGSDSCCQAGDGTMDSRDRVRPSWERAQRCPRETHKREAVGCFEAKKESRGLGGAAVSIRVQCE